MEMGPSCQGGYPLLWVKISLIAGAAASLAYAGWVATGVRPSWTVGTVSTLGLALLYGLVVVFSLSNVHYLKQERRLRNFWLFMGLGFGCLAVCEAIWMVYIAFRLHPLPLLTDILYFLYYPLVLAGLLSFPYARIGPRQQAIFWLDIFIVGVACVMLFWAVVLNNLLTLIVQDPTAILLIFYPLMDVLLFAGVAALLQRDVEQVPPRELIFLATGLGLIAVADSLFVYCRLNLLDWALPYLYILWLSGALCVAAAAGLQRAPKRCTGDSHLAKGLQQALPILRLALPYLSVATGWLLLIALTLSSGVMNLRLQGVLFGALILAILVLVRQYTVLRENVRLYTEMERLALTDSLTGLYNRHFFNETLQREINRASRYQHHLVLLLLDVDDFKLVNDTYGHLQGDVVLKMVAEALAEHLRRSDVLARFGGDEFAIILPETDEAGAKLVAEKIRAAVARRSFAGRSLGISIGLGIFHAQQTPEQLIERADRDLYRDKVKRQKSRAMSRDDKS